MELHIGIKFPVTLDAKKIEDGEVTASKGYE